MTQVFRLFISSTFSDFSKEREVLQSDVFPCIDAYCQSKGYQFQPIDLRWGVTEEAQLDQKTLEVCLNEVRACKRFPHPNFLIMVGDRYGWVPLPYLIKKEEFEILLGATDSPEDNLLLQTWYALDENQIPDSYILKERSKPYDEANYWFEVEQKLRDILQSCVSKLNLSDADRDKYFLSATEQEVNEGIFHYFEHTENQNQILKSNPDTLELDKKHVFAFVREFDGSANSRHDELIDDNLEPVEQFKKNIDSTLGSKNVLKLKTKLTRELGLDASYLDDFKEGIKGLLLASIDEQMEASNQLTEVEEEKQRQEHYLYQKSDLFSGRQDALTKIANYLGDGTEQALVIYGKSGLGKSSLMAQAINNAMAAKQNHVVYRFVGVSPESSNSKLLWASMLQELGFEIDGDDDDTFEQFSLKVYECLVGISTPTVLFIDAVDQLVNNDAFTWLPEKLPSSLKIVITALKDEKYEKDSRSFEVLSKLTSELYELTPFEVSVEFINCMLRPFYRKLQDKQLDYVLSQYKKVKAPLYLKVAEQELIHWKSKDYIAPAGEKSFGRAQALSATQSGIIAEYITNLSSLYHHDKTLVEQVLGYIYASVDGLSEKELLTLLSLDEGLVERVAPQTYHKNSTNSLPVVIWARLKFLIDPFLSLKRVDGVELMQFFHREFNDAIRQMDEVKSHHQKLIEAVSNKIIADDTGFEQSRYGKLFILTSLSFVFLYKEHDSLGSFITRFSESKNQEWLKSFVQQLEKTVVEYYKGGQVLEAQKVYLAMQGNESVFSRIEKKADFLYLAGRIEQSLSNITEAQKVLNEALKFSKGGHLNLTIQVDIAKTHRKGGNTGKAKGLLQKLLEDQLQKNTVLQADAMIQLGLCYFSKGNNEKAYKYYKLADDILVKENNRELRLYNWLGMSTVLANLDQVKEGLDLLLLIKKEALQFGYKGFYTDSLNGIAKKYLLLGNYKEALFYAAQALEQGQIQGNKILVFLMQGYTLEALAGLYDAENNLAERKTLEKKALEKVAFIKDYKKRKVVKEAVIIKLVNMGLEKWKKVYER